MKSAWSKACYRKAEKWRNWINSSKHSIASIIFFLSFHHRRFFRFSSVKRRKTTSFDEWRKTFSLETFFTRPHVCNWSSYRILSPPPVPVHRTTFLGQQNFIMKLVINRHPTWTLHFSKIKLNLQLWSHQCQALLRKKKKIRQGLNTLTHRPSSKLAWT